MVAADRINHKAAIRRFVNFVLACQWVACLQVKGLMLAPESLEAAAARVRRHFAGGGDDSGGPEARPSGQPAGVLSGPGQPVC